MNFKGIIVSLFALVLGAAALAGERHRMQVELMLDGDEGERRYSFDSADAGFELHELQIGESRTIVGTSGETGIVTRTAEGFEFNVDGEVIEMPDVRTTVDREMLHGIHTTDVHVNIDEEIHTARAIERIVVNDHTADGVVTIISDESLDETTKQRIRDTLFGAGHTGEVTFIESTGLQGEHMEMERVHIITKEVDVTN